MGKNKQKFTAPVSKNKDYTGTIEDLTHEGLGVVKIDNFPIFVEGALPQEEVTFKVVKICKKFCFWETA